MTSVAALLNVARSQLGYREGRNNDTKYGAWYGMNHVPWCAQYVAWVAWKASGRKDLVAPIAYTPALARWFIEQGPDAWGTTPKPGAVAFFDFPDNVNRIQHVGYVEKVNDDGTITTLEGNTSAGVAGSQSNGDGVYRRRRPRRYVVLYGYPKYTAAVARPTHRPTRSTTRHLPPLVVDGAIGPKTVTRWQRYIHAGTVDGRFDAGFRRDVQRWLGVKQDADWGPVTVAALRRKIGYPAGTTLTRGVVKAVQRHLNRNI